MSAFETEMNELFALCPIRKHVVFSILTQHQVQWDHLSHILNGDGNGNVDQQLHDVEMSIL